MTNELVIAPLRKLAVRVFYYGFTSNEQHKGAARLWDGIDDWISGQSPGDKKVYLEHARYVPGDDRLSLLIDRSLTRHSFRQLTLDDATDALLAAVLMYFIVNDSRMTGSIPSNLTIDPDTGYLIRRTVERTQVA